MQDQFSGKKISGYTGIFVRKAFLSLIQINFFCWNNHFYKLVLTTSVFTWNILGLIFFKLAHFQTSAYLTSTFNYLKIELLRKKQ